MPSMKYLIRRKLKMMWYTSKCISNKTNSGTPLSHAFAIATQCAACSMHIVVQWLWASEKDKSNSHCSRVVCFQNKSSAWVHFCLDSVQHTETLSLHPPYCIMPSPYASSKAPHIQLSQKWECMSVRLPVPFICLMGHLSWTTPFKLNSPTYRSHKMVNA